MKILRWLPFVLLCSITSSWAQDSISGIKGGALDVSVPTSPAFTVLGMTPEDIIRPARPRELATSLLNGFDKNGNFQSGFAVDTAPYMLFAGKTLTLTKYQTEKGAAWRRFASRIQTSVATTKGTDGDKTARIGVGLHITLFDRGDPRMDNAFLTDLATLAREAIDLLKLDPLPPPPVNPTPEQAAAYKAKKDAFNSAREKAANAATEDARAEYAKKAWNRSSMIVGTGAAWTSPDGNVQNLEWSNGGLWTSAALGFGTNSQFIFHARGRNRDVVTDSDTKQQFTQNSRLVGGKMRFGTSTSIGAMEFVYVRIARSAAPVDEFLRITTTFEQRLSSDLWFQAGIGGESGKDNGKNKLFILSELKWSFKHGD